MSAKLLLVSLFLGLNAVASDCDHVDGYQSAKACFLESFGKWYRSFEEPNSIGVSDKIRSYQALKMLLNDATQSEYIYVPEEASYNLSKAHYVAVINIHESDDAFYYFVLSDGANVTPKKVIAFMESSLKAEAFPNASKDHMNFSLKISNIPGWHYDKFEKLR